MKRYKPTQHGKNNRILVEIDGAYVGIGGRIINNTRNINKGKEYHPEATQKQYRKAYEKGYSKWIQVVESKKEEA